MKQQHCNNVNFVERFILQARRHHIELAQYNSFAQITFSLLLGAGYVASLPSLPRICCVAPEMRSSIAPVQWVSLIILVLTEQDVEEKNKIIKLIIGFLAFYS